VVDKVRGARVVIGMGDCTAAERALVQRIAAKVGATMVSAQPPFSEAPLDAMRAMLGSDGYTYDLGRADFVLSLGADWIPASPSPVESQRAFAALRRRDIRGRIVTASARLSITAAKSDLWIPVGPGQLATFGMAVMHQLLSGGQKVPGGDYPGYAELAATAGSERFSPAAVAAELDIDATVIESVAADLASHRHPVVVTDRSDPDTQWVGMALNLLVGAVGREGGLIERVSPALPSAVNGPALENAEQFPADLRDAVVLLVRANPVYALPRSSGWRSGLERAAFVADISSFVDETAALSHVVLPPSTALESQQLSWGSTLDGTSFLSAGPAAVPALYDTLPTLEILLRLAQRLDVGLPWQETGEYLAAVAEPLGAAKLLEGGGFAVVDPVEPEIEPPPDPEVPVPDDEPAPAPPTEAPSAEPAAPDHGRIRYGATPAGVLTAAAMATEADEFPLALQIHEPGAYRGGLGAHLPFLHGLTDGVEREVWRTVAEIHPETARRAGVLDGGRVSVQSRAGKIEAIARVRNGIRPGAVAIATGLGRRALGFFCDGHGANPFELVDATGTTFVRMEKLV
jgi:anaerobic selenocysteine-containing dehydrogenase